MWRFPFCFFLAHARTCPPLTGRFANICGLQREGGCPDAARGARCSPGAEPKDDSRISIRLATAFASCLDNSDLLDHCLGRGLQQSDGPNWPRPDSVVGDGMWRGSARLVFDLREGPWGARLAGSERRHLTPDSGARD